jgi:hypothetical protein
MPTKALAQRVGMPLRRDIALDSIPSRLLDKYPSLALPGSFYRAQRMLLLRMLLKRLLLAQGMLLKRE